MTAKRRLVTISFALLIIAAFFFGLGSFPLLGPDEPRYSQVAREMFERGDWLTPTLGGANWFEKPALLYWLQITSFKIFGVSEFSARFGSAIFGLLTVISLWILGRFLSDRNLADWLALIGASTIGILVFAHGASFDIILTFPFTASLICFFIYDRARSENFAQSAHRRLSLPQIAFLSLTGFYFFCGVGLLAKGLVGIILPYAIVGAYLLVSRAKLRVEFLASQIWGTILALAVAGSWYIPMYLTHGWIFIDEFFLQHHFARFTSNKYLHPQPFWFFFVVLPLMTIPWLPFFLASIWKLSRSLFVTREHSPTGNDGSAVSGGVSPLHIFGLCWLAVPVLFFSFSGSKLPGYVLPAVPAAIILTALWVSKFASGKRLRENALRFLAFGTLLTTVVLSVFVVDYVAKSESVKELIEAGNKNGFSDSRVVNLHTISHNAEFYAANRIVRTEEGKIRKFYGVTQVAEEIERGGGKPVLVIVPLEYLKELTQGELINSRVLADNGELAIASVELLPK